MKITRKQLTRMISEEIESLSYKIKKSTIDDILSYDHPSEVKTQEDAFGGGANIVNSVDHLKAGGSKEKTQPGIERLKMFENNSAISRQSLREIIASEISTSRLVEVLDDRSAGIAMEKIIGAAMKNVNKRATKTDAELVGNSGNQELDWDAHALNYDIVVDLEKKEIKSISPEKGKAENDLLTSVVRDEIAGALEDSNSEEVLAYYGKKWTSLNIPVGPVKKADVEGGNLDFEDWD